MYKTHPKKFVVFWLVVAVLVAGIVPAVLADGNGYGPGRVGLQILAGNDHVGAGTGGIWNSRDKLHIQLDPTDGWRIKSYKIDLGGGVDYSPPLTTTGNPKIGHFDYKDEFPTPYQNDLADGENLYRRTMVLDLGEDLGFQWGTPWADLRVQGVAIFLELVKLDDTGQVTAESGAWVVPELIVWLDAEDETAEATIEDTIEESDEIVADVATGEIVVAEVMEVKQTAKGKVARTEHQKAQKTWEVDEAEAIVAFEGGRWGWWFRYEMAHPRTGHFIDSPVAGLYVQTPTYEGVTDIDASYHYFPGEEIEIAIGSVILGSTLADQKISPLDIFPALDTEDPQVINMARLIQSLDVDGDPQGGIVITEGVTAAFEDAMAYRGLTGVDFSDDLQVEDIIALTIDNAALLDPAVTLVMRSAEDAKAHLDDALNNAMFRKRISRTPELASAKAKMNISPVWFPALRANGEPAIIEYYDEEGILIRTAENAKPIIITFTDADPVTGAHDAWVAVSRDDGNTWKRKNLSRSGDRTSFTTKAGEEYYGYCKKPVFQVKGNKVLVCWTSKFARGGKPAYAIDPLDEYTYDDPFYTEDIWGVGGPQRSIDYATEGFPEVGEVPYSAVWTCRGVICTPADLDRGLGINVGDIVWFKPERLTSGRRDANLIFTGAAGGAGFGLVWQEDPKGLRPGRAVGPGPGWGGATTHHKTDIWYSFVTWGNHSMVDANFVIGGDPEHAVETVLERPKALVPMSLPVRISDNDVLNKKNMMIDLTSYADDVAYTADNLTRCVKYEGGKSIVEADDPDAWEADYQNLRTMPDDHQATMNCTNCHVPYGSDPMADIPTQGAPIPLVVVDAESQDYLGGFNNGDCVSCHFSHVVPRDRLIMMDPLMSEAEKCADCENNKGGVWKETVEAYYPYDGYPYIYDSNDDPDGTHGYGEGLDGLLCGEFHGFTNFGGNYTEVAVTCDGRLMDGDTGAARGNLFLQPYVKEDGTTSAWAIVTYEETKGAGAGPPDNTGTSETHRDDYLPESGKNAIFHSFDFQMPDLVSAGNIMNMPECEVTMVPDVDGTDVPIPVLDGNGDITPTYLMTEEGALILDWQDRPQLAYENARRGRFILQGVGAIKTSRTVMMMVYKMGAEGAGRPSDIMSHRWVVPTTFDSTVDNPYSFNNVFGNRVYDTAAEAWYWASGPVNMSSVTPTLTTPSAGDPEWPDAYGEVKVVEWTQTADNLADLTSMNKYDDARAHRGQIRGDFVLLGFSYTANWAASRNGNDKYDFFIRRSFDGGETWTTDPTGEGVDHCITWTYPTGTATQGAKVEECNFYAAGAHETMRNLTQLPNNKESVIEPRIVAVPGTIKAGGVWTGIPEDKQNPAVFYVAWGTSSNPKKDPITKEQEEPAPADLYWSFSMDKGENYFEDTWYVMGNPTTPDVSTGDEKIDYPWMAKGDQEQGEVQLRMTPDGSRFYASWLDEGDEGSDIVFRRIMSALFPANNAGATTTEAVIVTEDDGTSSDDFTTDSGGAED